jgi:hypothetical protein
MGAIETLEPSTVTLPPDETSDVARVVEATRHLHEFRMGFAKTLETLALRATEYMPDNGKEQIEPMLAVLGTQRAHRLAERLYRIASDVTAGYRPDVDPDRAAETLRHVAHEAVVEVMAELYRDTRTCICSEVAR